MSITPPLGTITLTNIPNNNNIFISELTEPLKNYSFNFLKFNDTFCDDLNILPISFSIENNFIKIKFTETQKFTVTKNYSSINKLVISSLDNYGNIIQTLEFYFSSSQLVSFKEGIVEIQWYLIGIK